MARNGHHHKLKLVDVTPHLPETTMERALPLLIQLAKLADQMRDLEEEQKIVRRARDQIVDALAMIARTEMLWWPVLFLGGVACLVSDPSSPFPLLGSVPQF